MHHKIFIHKHKKLNKKTYRTIVSKEELELIKDMQDEASGEEHIEYCEVCFENNDRHHEIYFGRPVEIFDEGAALKPDPNQGELEFSEELPKTPAVVTFYTLKVGYYSWCNTEHFVCASCGALNAL